MMEEQWEGELLDVMPGCAFERCQEDGTKQITITMSTLDLPEGLGSMVLAEEFRMDIDLCSYHHAMLTAGVLRAGDFTIGHTIAEPKEPA